MANPTLEDIKKVIQTAGQTPDSKNRIQDIVEQLVTRGFCKMDSPVAEQWRVWRRDPSYVLEKEVLMAINALTAIKYAQSILEIVTDPTAVGPHFEENAKLTEDFEKTLARDGKAQVAAKAN